MTLPFLYAPARRPYPWGGALGTGGSGGESGGGGGPVVGGIPPDIVRPTFIARNPVVKFIGRGESATRIVTFAQVMPKGWFPTGQTACLRTTTATAGGVASGTQIRTQIDVHHRYDDSSARLLLIAAEVPALTNNEALSCSLEFGATHPSPGSALVWSTEATGKSVSATMGGATIDALSGVGTGFWRQGPLVLERRCQVDTVSGGPVDSARFVCDISLYKDGGVAADTQWCNDVAFAGGTTGNWTGICALSINGVSRFNSGSVTHYVYTRLLRWLSTYATRMPVAYPDMTVARDAGLLLSYDFGLAPSATRVSNYTALRAGGTYNIPYNSRNIRKDMGATGGRDDIGFLPAWSTANIVSGGSQLWHDVSDEHAEAAGAVPWHGYHRLTSTPVMIVGTLLNKWWDYRDTSWQPQRDGSDGWNPDTAHQPSCYTGPFIWGGRRVHLDGVLAQAAYGIATLWPVPWTRGTSDRVLDGSWANIFQYNQLRGGAWTLREVSLGWWFLPESGPGADATYKSYLYDVIIGNIAHLNAKRTQWTTEYGDYAGFIGENAYGDNAVYPPWQMDYAICSLVRVWLMGFDNMGAFLGWCVDGFMGHRCESVAGWNPRDGVAYNITDRIGTLNGTSTDVIIGRRVNGFAEAGSYMNGRWLMSGGVPTWVSMTNGTGPVWLSTSGGNYAILGAQSFVDLMQIFPTRTHLREQFDWLHSAGAPYLTAPFLANSEIMSSVMPRGETRG